MTDGRTHAYCFDDVRVEPRALKVFKAGSATELEPKALRVLLFLIENRGRLVEKSEILDAVWRDTHVTENAMTREIAKLRKFLGDNAKEPRYIETVHTRGYRFIAEVEELNGHAPGVRVVETALTRARGANGGNGHSPDPSGEVAAAALTFVEPEADGGRARSNGAAAQAVVALRSVVAREVSATEALESIASSESGAASAAVPRRSRGRRVLKWLLMSATLCLLLCGAFMLGVYLVSKYAVPEEPRAISPRVTRVTTWTGLDVNPSLSPDGNAVAYSSDHGGAFEIYVRQLTPGGREVQITNDGARNFEPAWSPDGKQLAYHSVKRGGIWLTPALGGVARQLTDFGARPAWSRDGTTLVFQSEPTPDTGAFPLGTSTLWLVAAQGGAPRQLTRAGSPVGSHIAPAWSPDGKRVAFLGANFRATQLWSVAVEGGELKQLTQVGTGDKGDPVYSPDGWYLYFTRTGMLWRRRVAPDGGLTNDPPVKVADMGEAGIHHLSFSANGQRLAYSAWAQSSNLWSLPLAADGRTPAGAPSRLTNETGTRNTHPAFTPDGARIAYITRLRGGAQDVWTMERDGKNAAPLTTVPGWRNWPHWLPGAERVVYEANWEGKRTLVAFALATGKEETLAPLEGTIEYPQLSPDGRLLAFNIRADGAVNVATMPATGGSIKQLTFDRETVSLPCWSPDGRLLAVQLRRGDDTHVAVMPSGGGEPVQLTFDHGQSWANGWSPDGKLIVFAAEREGVGNLYWVSLADKTVRQLTNYTKPNAYARYPAWSPLGRQIIYEYAETTGNIYVLDSQ